MFGTSQDPYSNQAAVLKPARWQSSGYKLARLYNLRIALFGDPRCRSCWHYGRVAGLAACYHPQGPYDCLGRLHRSKYLARPRLAYRLRHPRTWRMARFAIMKLLPQENSSREQEPLTAQATPVLNQAIQAQQAQLPAGLSAWLTSPAPTPPKGP